MADSISSGAPVSAPSSTSSAPSSSPSPSSSSSSAPSQSSSSPMQGGQSQSPSSSQQAQKPGLPPSPSAAKQADIRKMKLKVDGIEEELSEDDVIKFAQLGRASDKRFQQAAQMRKEAEGFIELLKTQPEKVLTNPKIGVNLRKFAEEYLAKQLELETLSPEQRKMREMEEQLKAEQDKNRAREEEAYKAQQQQLQQHYFQDYEKKVNDALSTSNVPKNPFTVKRMTDYLAIALQNGIDLEPSAVVGLVRQDYMSEISALLSNSDGNEIIKLFGPAITNKIRKADLENLKRSAQPITPSSPTPKAEEDVAAAPRPDRPLTIHEWRAEIAKRVKS